MVLCHARVGHESVSDTGLGAVFSIGALETTVIFLSYRFIAAPSKKLLYYHATFLANVVLW